MSTSVQPTSTASVPTPPVSTPSSAAPSSTDGNNGTSEFRYGTGPDVPVWARGKTASEVLGIANQATGVIQSYLQTGQVPPQHHSQLQPRNDQGQWVNGQWIQQAPNGYTQGMPPTGYSQSQVDPTEPVTFQQLNQWGQQALAQSVSPQLASMAQQMASLNYDSARRQEPKIFDKYGPEIDALLARIPVEQRSLDAVKYAVKIVKGDHADELGREYAAQLIAEQNPMLRSNGGAPGTPIAPSHDAVSLQSDKIPEDYRERLKRAGVTESVAKEFCDANGISLKDFVAQFEKQAITEVQQRMFRSNV